MAKKRKKAAKKTKKKLRKKLRKEEDSLVFFLKNASHNFF